MADPVTLMVLGRIVERSFIAAGGLLALWFGYRLFSIISTDRSRAELEGAGFALKAERIGPGIFFALFGACLLGYALSTQISITSSIDVRDLVAAGEDEPRQAAPQALAMSISGFSPSQTAEAPPAIVAVNTLAGIADRQGEGSTSLTGQDYRNFLRSIPALESIRRAYIDPIFGVGAFDTAMAIQAQCADNQPSCQAYLQDPQNAERHTRILDILSATLP